MAKWLGFPTVEKYKGLNLGDLPLNHAYVTVNTTVDNVSIYSVREDCFNCPYKLEKHLKAGVETSWQVDTSVPRKWRILQAPVYEYLPRTSRRGLLCQMRPTFQEYGVYRLNVGRCEVRPEIAPVNTYLPLYICSLILLGSCMIYALVQFLLKRKLGQKKSDKGLQMNDEKIEKDVSIRSLHIFRGLLLSLIIFITSGGGGYPIFNNEWGGLSIAECLFFAYVWSVGVNIPTVMNKAFSSQSKCAIVRDILVRSFVLVLLGTVIDSTVGRHSGTEHVNLWCPMQRMGIAYFIVASAYVLTVQRFEMKSKNIICKAITDLITLLWCWIISGFLLSIIIILISTILSFNCLSNIGLKGQRTDYSIIVSEKSENCNNGVTEYANKIFLAESKKIVDVVSYLGFSRGAIGTVSTVMYTMIGLKAGVVYLHHQSHPDRLKLWTIWATLFGVGGIIFAVLSYPLNFNLWPISSILLISTATLYFFAFIYILTAVCNFSIPGLTSSGVTSLAILCGHVLFFNSLLFNWEIRFDSHILYILQNLWVVSVWLLVGVILMKKKIKFDV